MLKDIPSFGGFTNYMKTLCFILLLAFGSCHDQTSSGDVIVGNTEISPTPKIMEVQEEYDSKDDVSTIKLTCGGRNFNLVNHYEYERNLKKIYVELEGKKIKTISLPSNLTVNGFSMNWLKKTEKGFEMSIEYGTILYYQKDFNFFCKNNTFYLGKIYIESFDKNKPEDSYEERTIIVKPLIPLTKFSINKYIED